MNVRCSWRGVVGAFVGAALLGGCGESPSVSSSEEKATTKGVVTYQGKPIQKGTITFDPSNKNRPMASAVTEPIGADGAYSISSLVGRNRVSFTLPGVATPQNRLNYTQLFYEVKPGENPYNIEIPAPAR